MASYVFGRCQYSIYVSSASIVHFPTIMNVAKEFKDVAACVHDEHAGIDKAIFCTTAWLIWWSRSDL